MKRYLSQLIVALVPPVAALLILLIYYSMRKREVVYAEGADQTSVGAVPSILSFWHGRQLIMPFIVRLVPHLGDRPISVLVSAHADGRLIANTIKYLGICSVEGSSSRKARAGSRALLETLERKEHAAITPDGPKGPAQRAKMGVVKLSIQSGAPIIPAALGSSRAWKFSSWDAMQLPKPFSRLVYYVEKPLHPSEFEEPQQLLEALEQALNRASDRADALARGESYSVPASSPS